MVSGVSMYKPAIVTSSCVPALRHTTARKMRAITGDDFSLSDLVEQDRAMHIKPELMQIANSIIRGEFGSEMVEECNEGYRIKHPMLIGLLTQNKDVVEDRKRAQARLTLISDLSRLGYRVALLAHDPDIYEFMDPNFLTEAEKAGVQKNDIIFLNAPEEYDPEAKMTFPRDMFVQLGNTVYINPSIGGLFNLEKIMKWAPGLKRDYSRIGFGGEVVIGDNFAFLSEQYRPDLEDAPYSVAAEMELSRLTSIGETEGTLQGMGYEVHTIPSGWVELFPPSFLAEIGTDKRFFIPNDHADFNVMHLPAENALFFNAPYYREHREALDPIIERIKPDIFRTLPPEDGLPVNSLPLPDGGVFMDKAAAESAGIIREAGIRVETTSIPVGTWQWGTWSGIHCITNTINIPL